MISKILAKFEDDPSGQLSRKVKKIRLPETDQQTVFADQSKPLPVSLKDTIHVRLWLMMSKKLGALAKTPRSLPTDRTQGAGESAVPWVPQDDGGLSNVAKDADACSLRNHWPLDVVEDALVCQDDELPDHLPELAESSCSNDCGDAADRSHPEIPWSDAFFDTSSGWLQRPRLASWSSPSLQSSWGFQETHGADIDVVSPAGHQQNTSPLGKPASSWGGRSSPPCLLDEFVSRSSPPTIGAAGPMVVSLPRTIGEAGSSTGFSDRPHSLVGVQNHSDWSERHTQSSWSADDP